MFDPITIARVARTLHDDRIEAAHAARLTHDDRLIAARADGRTSRGTAMSHSTNCHEVGDRFTPAERAHLRFLHWLRATDRLMP